MFAVECPASADVIYDNGLINGDLNAWLINEGFAVSDSSPYNLSPGTYTVQAQSEEWHTRLVPKTEADFAQKTNDLNPKYPYKL